MEKASGKNSISSKRYNRGLLLKLLATGACKSRIELSRATGLTKMTVSNIISEFMEKGIVVEDTKEDTQTCGRNPMLLKIGKDAPKAAGLLIFRDRIEAVLCSMNLEILGTERIGFSSLTGEALLENCHRVLDKLLENEKNILGIGVAVIGPVDIKKGILLNPPRFYGIENLHILEDLQKRYPYPIYLDHEHNSAALAEKLYGVGQGYQDFIFLGISNGIGSGIISSGRVYHNEKGFAPEIGHISIDRKGPLCSCRNKGCLELYASTYVVLEKLKAATGLDLTFREFFQLRENNAVEEILDQMVEDISLALISAVNILNPQLIVLGYDCMDWEESYVKKLEDLVNERRMVHVDCRIPIKKAAFGKKAQLLGAAVNAVNQVFEGNVLLLE